MKSSASDDHVEQCLWVKSMKNKMNIVSVIALAAFLVGFYNPPVAKNIDVPVKDEWRSCDKNEECTVRIIDCSNGGDFVALNKKFIDKDRIYYDQKCRERIKEGEITVSASRIGPIPKAECVKQKCEVMPEPGPTHWERFKEWFNNLY